MKELCRFCKLDLTSGIEMRTGACAGCIGRELACVEQTNARVPVLEQRVTELEGNIFQYLKASRLQEDLNRAQKNGSDAADRGASLDDNPYDPDCDEAGAWSYGLLHRDVFLQIKNYQKLFVQVVGALGIVVELARGGAGTDEILAKLEMIVEKIIPFLPETKDDTSQPQDGTNR